MSRLHELKPKYLVKFPDYYDELYQLEVSAKGYLTDVIVQFLDGTTYALYFTDITRLQQDFQSEIEEENNFFAEPNMVVLSKVTPQEIKIAIEKLVAQGFFDELGAYRVERRKYQEVSKKVGTDTQQHIDMGFSYDNERWMDKASAKPIITMPTT